MMKEEGLFFRRFLQTLWWGGLTLLAGSLAIMALAIPLPGGILLGIGVGMLGLNMILAGEIATGPTPRSYTVRGPVVRGDVRVKAGLSNLVMGICPGDRIANIQYGPFGEPAFEVRDGMAHLELKNSITRWNIATWQANIAGNVLWDVDVRSWLGDQELDLREARIERLEARTFAGHLKLICPIRGYVEIGMKSMLGKIDIQIPERVGARIRIKRGPMASLEIDTNRFLIQEPDHYTTMDFDTAETQVELYIQTRVGDIILK